MPTIDELKVKERELYAQFSAASDISDAARSKWVAALCELQKEEMRSKMREEILAEAKG